MRYSSDTSKLTQLGAKVSAATSPSEASLEIIPFECLHPLGIRLTCPEFTSLCPLTGQPDFAIIVLDYWPHEHLVESKSFKLYMQSFRNHGSFHEAVTAEIGDRIYAETKAKWLRCSAYFLPRGGIPIDVCWQSGAQPAGLYLPPIDIPTFRGR